MANGVSAEVLGLKNKIIEDITSYMKYGGAEDENDPDFYPDFDAGYTQENVNKCSAILRSFLSSLSTIEGAEKEESIMRAVKATVLSLNELNDQCDGNMIETDQRELLCELIITAANEAGLRTKRRHHRRVARVVESRAQLAVQADVFALRGFAAPGKAAA